MESLSAVPRTSAPRYCARVRPFATRGFWLIVGGVATFAPFAAAATSGPGLQQYQLAGSGTLTLDQPTLKSTNVQIKAYLTPRDSALSASPPAQEGGRFSLTALLSTSSLVCYNDTIFRDGFDGTGL